IDQRQLTEGCDAVRTSDRVRDRVWPAPAPRRTPDPLRQSSPADNALKFLWLAGYPCSLFEFLAGNFSSVKICCNCAIPREMRDFTVPSGTPKMSAISL